MSHLRDQYLLNPDVTFLNHGSFGATPRPVFEAYQAWQLKLERQPVAFMEYALSPGLREMRERLAGYLNCGADELAPVTNATFGVNLVARSLKLNAGDEVLTCDHEYGACDGAWATLCERRGVRYIRQPLPLPVGGTDEVIDQLWQGVTANTKVIYLSHITSSTAMMFPVAEICARARAEGIMTVIDGAHAPGQVELDMEAISADFYIGNLHKWVSAAKGVGFLYACRDRQHLLEPLVFSWDWGNTPHQDSGTPFLNRIQWWGTQDPAAFVSVPAALDFMEQHDWPTVRANCTKLVRQWHRLASELTGKPSAYADLDRMPPQMAIVEIPKQADLRAFKVRFNQEFNIEIPCIEWQDRHFIRISIQAYNQPADVEHLLSAMEALLRK